MGTEQEFIKQTKELIDSLKSICSQNGLGNDGNEYKIITQLFLYKFLNDKFVYEIKLIDKKIADSENWEETLNSYSDDDYELLLMELPPASARLKRNHFLSYLHNQQNKSDFHTIFDTTLIDIGAYNSNVFSIKTDDESKVVLFDELSQFITNPSSRDGFCKSIVNQLVNFSFEHMFSQKYDFFATIFEYLIKDYNTNGGGKYAEYYTPHSVAKIMANILVDKKVSNVKCYDPSAGSGTLLMNLAHKIGEDKCSIFSQDISQKSSNMLRLNLTLNNLVHSIPNIIQGNTLSKPHHREKDESLMKFDYIVSNPPFKLDFSKFRNDLESKSNTERFFAGIPKIPKAKKETMAIYLMFIQHIIFSLSENNGKAAVVVPTGFITAQSGIPKKIRERLIEKRMLKGVVSMPSNIFATTGTNVSVLFIDKENTDGGIVLMDASNFGTKVKEGKNQKTVLSPEEEDLIIDLFHKKEPKEDLSVVVSYEDIKEKNYSFSAGQYFEIKIEYTDITNEEFEFKINNFKTKLDALFDESKSVESDLKNQLEKLKYGK
jgi:type I restriction enzyme M protein